MVNLFFSKHNMGLDSGPPTRVFLLKTIFVLIAFPLNFAFVLKKAHYILIVAVTIIFYFLLYERRKEIILSTELKVKWNSWLILTFVEILILVLFPYCLKKEEFGLSNILILK